MFNTLLGYVDLCKQFAIGMNLLQVMRSVYSIICPISYARFMQTGEGKIAGDYGMRQALCLPLRIDVFKSKASFSYLNGEDVVLKLNYQAFKLSYPAFHYDCRPFNCNCFKLKVQSFHIKL